MRGGWICVFVCVFGGLEEKKTLSLTPDDILGSTSKASQGGRERGVQATDRAPLLLALLLKKICASIVLCVYVLCMRVCWVGGGMLWGFFCFFLHKQTGGL